MTIPLYLFKHVRFISQTLFTFQSEWEERARAIVADANVAQT